ncbi:hypothetical protein [Xanthobacter tagetidis]|uniref:Uncharacterized protein n=1 Tax=Xanthobacter tagetidis TaxID=60216 RepID=A0A3L7AJ70_9HYPH|nr:hypothetical protein [Xanthobacter tagetidis]MBB6306198.1 hypothetical protein [Xanthobacter tagetidis]RLP79482.1 hypothetical protein D9R14_07405 [Xanthobacter tagetidis]
MSGGPTPHPDVGPYIVRTPGRVELVVPLADGDGRQVLRVPLRRRTGLMMAADLVAAARDDWCEPRRAPEDAAPEPFIGFAGE